jgi:hypothetical protein
LAGAVTRTGVIFNPRSRHNRQADRRRDATPGVLASAPYTREALDDTLAHFAAKDIDLLVIDGGDGTVREVLSHAPAHFGGGLPQIAVLPSGKTNALARDLGAPSDWGLEQALAAREAGRFTYRSPIEVSRPGAAQPFARGFLFGAGAFVRAVDLAQRAHRLGAFDGFGVAVTFGAAAVRTVLGGPRNIWRRGVPMRIGPLSQTAEPVFVLLASTLKRLPLGVRPFGPPTPELTLLAVKAPPKKLLRALPPLLRGEAPGWLEAAGYRRRTFERFELQLEDRFILDGESFPGGELVVVQGRALEFVKP